MITNFKLYEKLNDGDPDVGDYVICSDSKFNNENEFIKDKIGRIIKIDDNTNKTFPYTIFPYTITYDNIPNLLMNYEIDNIRAIILSRKNIQYWSKDKKELEQILQANKFNI